MALELSSIVFKATTDELDAAVKKIETLGKSVEGLASSLGKLDKDSAAANKTQAQANLLTAKAATETAKAATETAKANAIVTKAQDQNTAATERLAKATKEKQSVEQQQEAITRIMSDGYSRGQATILARAEALGEVTTRTAELLKTQRAMQASDPFDKSIGAVTLFENRTRVLTVANELYQQSLGFTKEQLMDLGREHVRLSEQFKVQGKDMGGLDAEFQKIVQSAQKVTQVENTLATSMKNADKATIDAGKANAYIENELQKVRFALQANNEELNRSTSNSLVRFENALKKSGLTLDQQRVKIDEYRKSQIELQKTQKANQTDYITRAVGPQITDIIVGLSTGQSPLTVMMQQGGQLRDQFGMMGIAAADMATVMRTAMAGMASSILDTGKAIAGMLVGGIYDASKAIIEYALELSEVGSILEYVKYQLTLARNAGSSFAGDLLEGLQYIGGFLTGAFAVAIATAVVTVVALGVAFYQVTKAQDDLAVSLVSSGAKLGLTSTEAFALAASFKNVGATSSEILNAFSEISKEGNISRESLISVAEAALTLEKSGGQAASETIKMFSKLGEKPVQTLSEYTEKTGLLTQAQIIQIDALMQIGEKTEAVEKASKMLTIATEEQAVLTVASLSDISRLWLTVKNGVNEAWRSVQDFATSDTVLNGVKIVLETVAIVATEVWYGIKGIGESLGGLGAIAAAVMTDIKNLDTNFTASKTMLGVIEEQDNARKASYEDSIARIMQEGKYSREEIDKTARVSAEARKVNAEGEEARLYNKKVGDELDKKLLSQSKKQLTQQEYINKQLDEFKKNTDGASLSTENLAKATAAFGEEWKRAQPKAKKVQLTQEQKDIIKGLEERLDLENQTLGLSKEYNNQMQRAQLLFDKDLSTQEQRQKTFDDIEKRQPRYIASLAAQKKLTEGMKKDNESILKLKEDSAKFLTDEGIKTGKITSDYNLRLSLLGKTEEQQKKINQEAELQNKLSESNNDFEKQRTKLLDDYEKAKRTANGDTLKLEYDLNAALIALDLSRAERQRVINQETAVKAAESMQKEFDAIKSSITDVITTALFDGGKAGSKKLRDQVVAAFRKNITVVIDAAVNTLMGSATSSLLGGNKEGGIGSLSNVASLASLASSIGTVGSQVVTGAMSLTNAIGTIGANATGTGISGLLASNAGFGTAAPTAMSSITGAIGAIPGWGWALMAGVAVAAMLEGGETRSGATYGTGANGKAVKLEGPSGGEIASTQVQKMFNTAKSSIQEMLTGFGSKAVLTGFTAGLESSDAGKGFAFAGGQINGVGFGEYKGRSGGQFAMGDKTAEQAVKDFELNLTQSILEGLQVTEDIPASIAKLITDGLDGDEVKNLSQEAVNTILNNISLLTKSVNLFNTAMTALPFEYLKNLSFDTAAGLIAAGGGLETLMGNLSGFYDNFYTEVEKTTNLTNTTSAAFAELGIIMPEINESTRAWYRAEVERLGAMDLGIEANALAYTSALSLQGAVNQLAPSFDDVAQAAIDAAANMTSAWASVMQARGVASAEVTRFTAQADISSAFAEYKKTDKNGIISADQFLTITQADFASYLPAHQQLISKIITGFASIDATYKESSESIQNLNNSYQSTPDVIDKSIQATIDYNLAIAEATGNTEEYARLQREAANATKLANGWTQVQIDTLNTAVDLSVELKKQKEALALVKQSTSDYNLAMADAAGNTKESARLQREVANATKLANGWTQVQIDTLNRAVDAAQSLANLKSGLESLESARTAVVSAFKAIEDTAKNTQAAVNSAKEAITQGYVNAVDQQTQAQAVINDLIRQAAVEMAGFATSIRDFLLQMSTTDIGADSKLSQLGALIGDFNETANKAKGGDTKAYGSITGKASSLLTAGKDQFSTAIEFARFSSNIGNTLAELATIADGKAGPLAEAVDPMVKAQADLLKATLEVEKWTLAVSESGAATSLTVADYATDWRNANAANIKAQADLLEAQLMTKDINKQLVTVLGDLAILIGTYNTANTTVPVYGGSAPITKVGTSYLGAGSDIKTIQDLYSVNLGREGDIAGMDFWAKAFLGDGVISAEERQQFAISAMPEYLASLNSFAVGTNSVPTDMLANIHKGERIIPEADNTELMQRLSSPMVQDNSELVLEIQRLNNRLATIESNTASTAGHAAKTARLLDRAMPDGDALATREAVAI